MGELQNLAASALKALAGCSKQNADWLDWAQKEIK